MGQSGKAAEVSAATDGEKFRDCKTGKLYRMKRVDGAMVTMEISDGGDNRREVDLLSSLLSTLHCGERGRTRDEEDAIVSADPCGLDEPAHDTLGNGSYPG